MEIVTSTGRPVPFFDDVVVFERVVADGLDDAAAHVHDDGTV